MIGSPHYFGPVERRRFSMLHWPPGDVKGCALICPPIGYENVCAHQTLRQLARQLSDRGIVAMRIDYDGTGNSIGDERDTSRVQSWTQSVRDALDELATLGCGPPVVIGVRLGGTIAASCLSAESNVSGLILWDPIINGRRHMRTLKLLAAPDLVDSSNIVVGGIPFTDETLDGIGELRLDLDRLPSAGLLIERSEHDPGEHDLHPSWAYERLHGTSAMLDTEAELSTVPREIIRSIIDWTVTNASPPDDLSTSTFVSSCVEHAGDRAFEHSATRLGTSDLFAVESRVEGSQPTTAVLILNNGVAASVGPGRAWIELARRVAADGHRAVRLDLSGLGDSPPRAGHREQDDYSTAAGRDIAVAVSFLVARGVTRVACVGLCSGAVLSFDGALKSAQIDVIISINGRFDRPFHDARHERNERAARQTIRLAQIPLHKTRLFPLFERVPGKIWSLLDRLHLVALPTHALRRYLARPSGQMLLIFGREELGLGVLQHRDGREFDRIVNDPRVQLTVIDHLDHSMFDPTARQRVFEVVTSYLNSTL